MAASDQEEFGLYYDPLTPTTIEWSSLLITTSNLTWNETTSNQNQTITTPPPVLPDYSEPRRDPLLIVIPITIIYSTIFVIGVVGNVITCVVISRNKSMHTATNYYLFSLAVSDLLLLLFGVPQDIYTVWNRYPFPFGITICILQGFAAETSANATVLTITAFTVERYIAICKPFLSHTVSKPSRAVRYIIAVWIIAMCLALPQALALEIDESYGTCALRRDRQAVFTISAVIVFIFPMCVLTILYVLIGLQLRRSKVMKRGVQLRSSVRLKHSIFRKGSQRTVVTINYQNSSNSNTESPQHYSESMLTSAAAMAQQQQQQQEPLQAKLSLPPPASDHHHQNHRLVEATNSNLSQSPVQDGRINYSNNRGQYHSTRHVVKMLVAVVIAFFLCWAPFHAQRLFAVYCTGHCSNNKAIQIAFDIVSYISGILYYISTCINPVLYNIMSHKFREAFKDTLANYLYRRYHHHHHHHYRYHPSGLDPSLLRQRSFSRNVSLRSNSNNSHSVATCSNASVVTVVAGIESLDGGPAASAATESDAEQQQQQPFRYLETSDLTRLKRPLVVTFRKIPTTRLHHSRQLDVDIDGGQDQDVTLEYDDHSGSMVIGHRPRLRWTTKLGLGRTRWTEKRQQTESAQHLQNFPMTSTSWQRQRRQQEEQAVMTDRTTTNQQTIRSTELLRTPLLHQQHQNHYDYYPQLRNNTTP